jgi:NAD(P)-dependent dehydrogenase (short-subunit alcohol dehydrogenase family)
MSGKLIIITGASSGLGKFSALELVNKGAKVIFACRNETKTKNIFKEISDDKKNLAIYENLELSNFKSVLNFVKNIKEKYQKIDILMNNAGAAPVNFKLTEDNFESYIQANFLGHVVLTYLLMDHMNTNSRIINLSSIGHNYCTFNKDIVKKIYDGEYVKNTYFSSVFSKNILYHVTKLMMIYFTQSLSDYFSKNNISIKAVCLHPGVVNTEFMAFYDCSLFTQILFKLIYPIFKLCTKNTEEGSQTQLYLSYLDYAELASGKYYADCKFGKISKTAKDLNLGKIFMNNTIEKLSERLPQYEKDFNKFINKDVN